MPVKMTFWFEFASTYSYLSAMRIEGLAQQAGVEVVWRPFLLGPIFKAQGWETTPFHLYPAKGRYMWRDMERLCAARGLPLLRPSPENFPQNGLRAARIALAALEHTAGPAFCRELYLLQFAEGRQISDPLVLTDALTRAGLPDSLADAADDPGRKLQLRENMETASALGLFGAPSFTVGSEVFWGDDRLEVALDWARKAK